MNDNLNEARAFIKNHFQKSEWKVCRLNQSQLADLISSASNIKITSYELEKIMKGLGYRHHQSTGWYMIRLSDKLAEYARERLCIYK